MRTHNKNILILSAGRRVGLVNAFKNELKIRAISAEVFTTDLNPPLAAACQVADNAFGMCRVTDEGYLDQLLELCLRQKVRVVIPTIDTELIGLAGARLRFAEMGIHLVVSDESLVRICRDKRVTLELFKEINVDTPRLMDRDGLSYPCFAKPYDGSRSIGAVKISDPSQLTEAMRIDPKLMFTEFIDSSFDEYTVDAYFDRSGQLKCLVPRCRLEVRDGEISKGVTRKNDVYEYLIQKMPKIQGARGCVTLQLFANVKSKIYAALEINPRFGGGYPLSYSAGANYPGWIIDEYILGEEISFFDGWESDLLMLRYDAHVLVHGAR